MLTEKLQSSHFDTPKNDNGHWTVPKIGRRIISYKKFSRLRVKQTYLKRGMQMYFPICELMALLILVHNDRIYAKSL